VCGEAGNQVWQVQKDRKRFMVANGRYSMSMEVGVV